MCGIYGTTLPYRKEQVEEKLRRTKFRGPDQMGIATYETTNKTITFGHNRLSIIDLDSRSDQPFSYLNQVHIVFNGEIYNFKEIRGRLRKKGYEFRTTGDTEVICASYLEYGENCVHHLNGMFAFVIYDKKKNVLFGAKDRLGQKPFYYYKKGKNIEFSSQISSIQLFNQSLSISSDSIYRYLSWKSIPTPYSIFNEVKKLEDGHCFTFDLDTGKIEVKQYWDVNFNDQKYNGTYQEALRDLDNLITDAVDLRMFAEVPLGIFLSGGVDSSLIAALACKKISNKKVKTFSVKFEEKGYDESIYAKQVAEHLGTDHIEIYCNYGEGIDLIENFSYYYDEPFADSSAIPSMLLAKHTRKEVTVALSGDGGDESFIGYPRYGRLLKLNKYLKLPYNFRKMIGVFLKLSGNYRANRIKRVLDSKNLAEVYLKSVFEPDDTYLIPQVNLYHYKEFKYLMNNDKNILERASDFDLKTYLNWDINTKVDRASMAFSLEARSPLLDYRVVEFARNLPTEYKLTDGIPKRILKSILYKYVPKELFTRPKAGFTMPFEVWFREDLKDYVLEELTPKNLESIPHINPEITFKLINQHIDGKYNHYLLIWKLLVLKQWLKNNGKGFSVI